MSTFFKLLRGSSFTMVGVLLAAVLNVLILPYMVHTMGDRNFGLWTLIYSLNGYVLFVDLGLSKAIVRYLSPFLANRDYDSVNEVASAGSAIFWLLFLIGVLFSLLGYFIAPRFFDDPQEGQTFAAALFWVGVAASSGFPLKLYKGILEANLRHDIFMLISISRLLSLYGLIIVLLHSSHGLVALSFAVLFSSTLCLVLSVISSYRLQEKLKIKLRFNRRWDKKLFGFGALAFMANLSELMRLQIQIWIIAGMLGAAQVTIYTISARILQFYMSLVAGAMQNLMPLFANYHKSKEKAYLVKRYFFSLKLTTFLAFFFGLTLIFFGKELIILWVGEDYIQSYSILAISCVGITISVSQNPGASLLYAVSGHKILAVAGWIQGGFIIVLSVLLINYMGLIGVAYGLSIPMTLNWLGIMPYYFSRSLGIKLSEYYPVYFLALFKCTSLMAIYYFFARNYLRPLLIDTLLVIGIGGIVYFSVGWFFVFSSAERSEIAVIYRRALRKLFKRGELEAK